MKRYYVAQWSHFQKGWLNIPGSATLKEKEADRMAEEVARNHGAATRTHRKPHGWEPDRLTNKEMPNRFSSRPIC